MLNKTLALVCAFSLSTTLLYAQPAKTVDEVWAGVIELPKETLTRHILHDLPGSIVALVPQGERIIPYLMGNKVLKDSSKLPELKMQPTVLISNVASKSTAGRVGFLSFVSASMEDTDEVKFNVTETSHAAVFDSEIDWGKFATRISAIKSANPNLPQGTVFGVVRVGSVISITHQIFSKVKRAAEISGWGFAGGGKYLSSNSEESTNFKVGVALTYPDVIMSDIFALWPKRIDKNNNMEDPSIDPNLRTALETAYSLNLSKKIKGLGWILPDGDNLNIGSQ